jgi:hypothetical protein
LSIILLLYMVLFLGLMLWTVENTGCPNESIFRI